MFKLPDLPYAYGALEPHIDEQTMRLHHDKHHATYVDNLNKALENQPDFQNLSLEELLQSLDKLPEEIRTKVRNHGGGHYNHTMFWQIMGPQKSGEPQGDLAGALNKSFGDLSTFKEQFTQASLGIFGSGWAWVVKEGDHLKITATPNQDSPIMEPVSPGVSRGGGKAPILGLDVWEHAYYLKYQNKRAEYIESWWKVVNWEEVARRLGV